MNDADRIKLARTIRKVVRDEGLDLDDSISDLLDAVLDGEGKE